MMEFSKAIKKHAFAQLFALLDPSIASGVIEFYEGDTPSSPDDPIKGQKLLATLCWGPPREVSFSVVNDVVVTSGECAFARMTLKDGTVVCDAEIGEPGWGSELELNTTSLRAGGPLRLSGITFVNPSEALTESSAAG